MASAPPLSPRPARTVTITDKQLSEFQEAFAFFDGDRDGRLTAVEFSHVVRSLGLNPTEAELKRVHRVILTSYGSTISFNDFVHLVSTFLLPTARDSFEYAALAKEAFTTFNKLVRGNDTDKIRVEDLRKLMMEYGDALPNGLMDNMERAVPVSKGSDGHYQLACTELVDTIMGKPPRSRAAIARERAAAAATGGSA